MSSTCAFWNASDAACLRLLARPERHAPVAADGDLVVMNRVHRHEPETPVIAISGRPVQTDSLDVPDFARMASRLGAVSSVQKPFRPRIAIL
jgi:CheY-like chemotaxis protein